MGQVKKKVVKRRAPKAPVVPVKVEPVVEPVKAPEKCPVEGCTSTPPCTKHGAK